MARKYVKGKVSKTYPAIYKIDLQQIRFTTQDISDWKNAIDMARSRTSPRRTRLVELYDNILIDGHLESVIEKRLHGVINKQLTYSEPNAEGKVFDGIEDAILHQPWLREFQKQAGARRTYGHALIELQVKGGQVVDSELIPAANVTPEKDWMSWNPYNQSSGINYIEDRIAKRTMISYGRKRDYGKLMTAAQYVIYKRGGFGDWAQFAELFGQPFREARYPGHDEDARKKLKQALEEMGGSASAVIPDGTSIQFHDNNGQGKSEVFRDLIIICNDEMSKIFLGNTLTTSNDGVGSNALGQIHREAELDIALADTIEYQYLLNYELKPRLTALGYPVANGQFTYDRSEDISKEKMIEIAIKVAKEVPIADAWWYETFGVERPSEAELMEKEEEPPEPNDDEKKKPLGKKPKPKNQKPENLTNYYGLEAEDGVTSSTVAPERNSVSRNEMSPELKTILKTIIDRLHRGEALIFDDPLYQQIADEFMQATHDGYGGTLAAYSPDKLHHTTLLALERDVQMFSAFKTGHMLRRATDLLIDANGQFRTYAAFEQEILKLAGDYLGTYLQAEYATGIASAQQAALWVEITENAEDFPFLKYDAVNDDRTRPHHAELDGVVKRHDDPFWDTWYPPNGWRCRCTVVQLAEAEVDDDVSADLPPEGFRQNLGKTKRIFPSNHPYYTEQTGTAPLIRKAQQRAEKRTKNQKPKTNE